MMMMMMMMGKNERKSERRGRKRREMEREAGWESVVVSSNPSFCASVLLLSSSHFGCCALHGVSVCHLCSRWGIVGG